MESRLHGGVARLRVDEVGEPGEHHFIRPCVDGVLHRRRGEQGADHGVTAAVAEQLGCDVRVDAVLAHHALAARAERGDVRGDVLRHGHARGADRLERLGSRHAGVDVPHGLHVKAVRPFHLDGLPVRVHERPRPQVLHRPVHGLQPDLLGDLVADFLPLAVVLALEVAQEPRARVAEPLHLPQARLRHVGHGGVHRFLQHDLVRGVLCLGHPARKRLLKSLELRLHLVEGRLPLDLLLGREHAIKHASHFRSEDREILAKLAAVDRVQVIADRLVHPAHPCCHAVEYSAQLLARSLALPDVHLCVVGHLLLERRTLLDAHR